MATTLSDIKCFYNHKTAPVSMYFGKRKKITLMPKQYAIDQEGNYIVTEELFSLAKQGKINYDLKKPLDVMIKTEPAAEIVKKEEVEDINENEDKSEVETVVPRKILKRK